MQMRIENGLSPRQRGRLRRARETGVLEVTNGDGPEILRVFGAWCWLLRLPLVWFARNSPHSRYGAVRLDLFPTGKRLTEQGQAALRRLAPWAAAVSPHDGVWRHVPRGELPYLAGRVLRAAVNAQHAEAAMGGFREAPVLAARPGGGQVIEMGCPRSVSA